MTTRARVVEIAESQLGITDPTGFWIECGVKPPFPKYWCGAFALFCLRMAELCGWRWADGVGFLSDGKRWRLKMVKRPEPGDVGYLKKNQHHCIVERVEGSVVHTIDGNAGPAGGVVARCERPLSSFAAFYSIESLLPKAEDP